MSAPFEERNGVVLWGLQSRPVALAVGGSEILKDKLFNSTLADEGTWTLEDRKMVHIALKTKRDAANCWTSLLESEHPADPWGQDQTRGKLTLERFQKENPGFDFSGAGISGNYTKGGLDFSNLEKQLLFFKYILWILTNVINLIKGADYETEEWMPTANKL